MSLVRIFFVLFFIIDNSILFIDKYVVYLKTDPIVSAMGTGRSKKEAKHAAAKAVLDKLIGVNTDSAESPLPNSLPE